MENGETIILFDAAAAYKRGKSVYVRLMNILAGGEERQVLEVRVDEKPVHTRFMYGAGLEDLFNRVVAELSRIGAEKAAHVLGEKLGRPVDPASMLVDDYTTCVAVDEKAICAVYADLHIYQAPGIYWVAYMFHEPVVAEYD